MSGWKTLLAASALVLSVVTPAEANVGTEEVTGKCTYAAVTMAEPPDAWFTFVVAGFALGYSTTANQPYVTSVTCTLVSPTQPGVPGSPPTTSFSTTYTCPGAVCATPPGGAVSDRFPVRPAQICISGYALFGPDLLRRNITPACGSAAITP